MKKKKLPIFLELTISSLLIIVSILFIYTVVQLFTFGAFSSKYEREYLTDKYSEIVSLSKNINTQMSENAFYEYLKTVINGENDEYVRIYSSNKVYYDDGNKIWNEVDYDYNVENKNIKVEFIDFNIYRVLTAPLTIDNTQYAVQIVQDSDIFSEFLESYFPTLGIILILGIILSGIGAIYVSRSFIKRLTDLTKTMNEIKEKGITKRAEVSELNDEIDKVKIVFNSMMDEVQEAFDEQGRFVSDASHELKTPLTALQGHLNMLKRWGKNDKERLEKSLDICLNEVERLKKIVNDMLILSKVEKAQVNLETLPIINAKEVVYEVIDEYKILNEKVNYTVNIEDSIKMKMDPNDLKQLLIIFIDNAIKYNNKENIEFEIALKLKDKKVQLEVKDNRMGIPKDEINSVMKRFYKVDKSRVNNNFFGIGLSIANRIVDNYNGNIKIESKLNEYTKIIVMI